MNLRSFLVPLAVLAAAGCDHASTPAGTGIPPMRIAGTWRAAIAIYSGESDSCIVSATAVVNQNPNVDSFTGAALGEQTCYGTAEGSGEPQVFYAPFGQGEISGTGVRFVGAGCVYLGLASGDPVNKIAGNVECPYRSGTWEFNWNGPGNGST